MLCLVVGRCAAGTGIERTWLDGIARVAKTATVVPRWTGGYGIDYAGVRNGYRVQSLWEKLALDEVASSGGGTKLPMQPLGDPELQALASGVWNRWQVLRVNPSGGSRITIHYSKHSSGLIDDVKIVYRGSP